MTTDAVLDDVLRLVGDFWWSAPMSFLAYLLLFFFKNPEKISKWSALVASMFDTLSKRAARHSVSSDIQARLSSYIQSNHMDQILPYGLKFKWIHGEKTESYIEESDVIVIMSYHDNNARNFAVTVNQHTSKGFLPAVRHDMPADVLAQTRNNKQARLQILRRQSSDKSISDVQKYSSWSLLQTFFPKFDFFFCQ